MWTRAIAVLGLAGLAACKPPVPAPTPPAAGPAASVQEAQLDGGFITIRLEIPPAPPGPKPAVITLVGQRDVLLSVGIVVVTYTIHWELLKGLAAPAKPAESPPKPMVGKWLLASPSAKFIGQAYFGLIAGNAKTVTRVIDHLTTVPDVDPARIGITGASTNGFVALQAVAADARLTAAAVLAACGDYHRFLHLSGLAMDGEPLDLDPKYESWLNTVEPIGHPRRMTHTALLMVNGSEDHAIPIACARDTAHAFRAAYARAGVPQRFRWIVLEGAGHNLSEDARWETLGWLYRWLVRSPRDS